MRRLNTEEGFCENGTEGVSCKYPTKKKKRKLLRRRSPVRTTAGSGRGKSGRCRRPLLE